MTAEGIITLCRIAEYKSFGASGYFPQHICVKYSAYNHLDIVD
jgi:hypothetical protein